MNKKADKCRFRGGDFNIKMNHIKINYCHPTSKYGGASNIICNRNVKNDLHLY